MSDPPPDFTMEFGKELSNALWLLASRSKGAKCFKCYTGAIDTMMLSLKIERTANGFMFPGAIICAGYCLECARAAKLDQQSGFDGGEIFHAS